MIRVAVFEDGAQLTHIEVGEGPTEEAAKANCMDKWVDQLHQEWNHDPKHVMTREDVRNDINNDMIDFDIELRVID